MLLLSFDVGIVNLAFIIIEVIDETNTQILEWKNINLKKEHFQETKAEAIPIANVCELLNSYLTDLILSRGETYDKIIIENQIGPKAIRMKTIQGCINMFFIMNGYSADDIINYSARNKLVLFEKETNGKSAYKNNKTNAVKIVKQICDGDNCYNTFKEYFKASKKKDDLADCLLQCLHFMARQKLVSKQFIMNLV